MRFKGTGVLAALQFLRTAAGIRAAASSDYEGTTPTCPPLGEGLLFEQLGIAVLQVDLDQARALSSQVMPRASVEYERRIRGGELEVGPASPADSDHGTAASGRRALRALSLPLVDTTLATWGLQATDVVSTGYCGRGIRVAVLDTGLDLQHPDFAGRDIVSRSFVTGLTASDGCGHGTFSAGVACGPQRPAEVPRYGIAHGADLYVGRVLDDKADGSDGDVIAGINWAVRNRCAVALIALGAPVFPGDSPSQVYEQAVARALAAGTLLVAPAGNQSQRPDTIAPVEQPANCPWVLAVGAVDPALSVAPFSNGGVNPAGGEVNLAAPGVAVWSASPCPTLHQTGNGTSTAAAHVAGIAALFAEAQPQARGASLRKLLLQTARALPASVRDVGAGLVQAPA